MSSFTSRPNTALIIVDMQRGVVADAHDRQQVVANLNALLERARSAGATVVWVQHCDDQLKMNSPEWQLIEELVPTADEPLIHKSFGDSFEATNLAEVLADANVGHVIVTGAQTEACIRSTLHGAFVRGYDTTLVDDAHTTDDMTKWGAPIDAAQAIAHTNMYWRFSSAPDRVAEVCATADVEFH